jgi:hypothetical protein
MRLAEQKMAQDSSKRYTRDPEHHEAVVRNFLHRFSLALMTAKAIAPPMVTIAVAITHRKSFRSDIFTSVLVECAVRLFLNYKPFYIYVKSSLDWSNLVQFMNLESKL